MFKRYLFFVLFTVSLLYSSDVKIKEQLYSEIKTEFKTDFNAWESVFFKDTLMIRFSKNDILYKRGQADMQESFKIILKDFTPRFVEILSNYKEYIGSVSIKGHTSSENRLGKTIEDKFERNLELSQKRADVVLEFIKGLSDPVLINNKNWIESTFSAEGVSSLEPIFNPNGKENKELSRRTEIVIVLKNPELKSNFIKKEDKEALKNEKIKKAKLIEEVKKIERDTSEDENKRIFTLEQYIKRLLAENPTLGEQHYFVKSFKKDIEKAKANFRPTVSLSMKHKKYLNSLDKQTQEQSRDITIRYNLFNGFKDENEEKISLHSYTGSVYTKEQVENDLIYLTAEAYIALQKAHEVYELSRKNYEDYIAWEEKSEIKFQNGLLSLKDFSKIQARSISRYVNFEEDTKRYIDGITTMQKYLDFNDDEIPYFETPAPESQYFENVNLSIEDSKLFSPYIKEANANIKLYRSKMDQAEVNFFPTLDLVGTKSVTDEKFKGNETKTDDTTISLEAKLELYSGGADQANFGKKLMEYREKIQKRDAVVRDVEYKVDMSINKLNLLTIKDGFFQDLVNKREEEHVAANYDFKFGKIDENGLLDIVDSLYNAKRQLLENRFDLIAAKYKLLEQIGTIKKNILEGE